MSLSLLLLGAGSGLCWGTSDFFGGMQARSMPALAVTVWSQLTGAFLLLIAILVSRQHPTLPAIAWGAIGGVFGGCALLVFYRALAVGSMSIVAPISSCGALVPVAVSIVSGHTPPPLADAGIVLAMLGIVFLSLHPDPDDHPSGDPRQAIGLALLAAVGFGGFYVFLHQGGQGSAAQLWPVIGVRFGSLTLLSCIIIVGRRRVPWPGKGILRVAPVGILDTTANVMWAYAAVHGNLGVAAVLGSLYPLSTVVLGRIVLDERLTRLQGSGIVLALAGVALVST